MLGFPADDADRVARLAKELMESEFPLRNRTERGEGFANAFPEFAQYIDEQIDERERSLAAGDARHDVVSRLIELEIDGVRLSRTQARALTRNLITGGLTTTSQLLGNLLHQILTVPGVERAARADDAVLARAVEESLRVSPPILFVARMCAGDDSRRRDAGAGRSPRRRDRMREPGRVGVRRRRAVRRRPRERGPTPELRLRPTRVPGRDARRAVARIGIQAFFDHFPAGAVSLEPGFAFENVSTFFEVGPRSLPVVLPS